MFPACVASPPRRPSGDLRPRGCTEKTASGGLKEWGHPREIVIPRRVCVLEDLEDGPHRGCHMQARFYAPWYGRFLSPDPGSDQHFEHTQKWNIYSYVSNNPTMSLDPDGMQEATGVERMIAYNNKKHGPAYASGDPKRIAKADAEMAQQRTGTMVVASIGLGARFLGGLGVRGILALTAAAKQNPQAGQQLTASVQQAAQSGEGQIAAQRAGQWVQTAEHMSESASAYQSFITSTSSRMSYLLNGVKFDGVTNSGLVDAKGPGYAAFVDKAGNFVSWFKGAQGLVDQATRQIQAAGGQQITWYFAEGKAAQATQRLLQSQGINGINIVVREMKK